MVVRVLAHWESEDGLVDVGVKFLTHRLELHDMESLKAVVHDVRGHGHALRDVLEVHLHLFKVIDLFKLDFLSVLAGKLEVVSHVEEVLSELGDREFSSLIDLLLVALDGVVVFCNLIDKLFLVLLDLLLELLNFSILVCDELLNLGDVFLGERLGLAVALAGGRALFLFILLLGSFLLFGLFFLFLLLGCLFFLWLLFSFWLLVLGRELDSLLGL